MAAKRRRKRRYVLKHEDILEMKELRLKNPKRWNYAELGKAFGVAQSTAFKAVNGQYHSEKQVMDKEKGEFNAEMERDIKVLESYLGVINEMDLKQSIQILKSKGNFGGDEKESLRRSAITAMKLILGMQQRRGMMFKLEAENVTINQQNIQQNVEIRTEVATGILEVVKRFVHPDIYVQILKELSEVDE